MGGEDRAVRMPKNPAVLTLLVTAIVIPFAVGLTEASYWLYGARLGFHGFIIVAAITVSAVLAPGFIYPWVAQTFRLREQTREIDRLACIDPLTGLPNRRAFFEQANLVFGSAPHGSRAVLMIDLDDFKSINVTHGHAAGDEVLTKIANTIRRAVEQVGGPEAIVARIGGDELAAVITYRDSNDVLAMADRLCAEVRQSVLRHQGTNLSTTLSVGIAFCLDTTTIDAALSDADAAMYRAKRGGRDGWRSVAQGGRRDVTRRARTFPTAADEAGHAA